MPLRVDVPWRWEGEHKYLVIVNIAGYEYMG